jgi:hypothetical protein
LRAEAIPVLLQMLMASNVPTRQLLVELLAEIPGRQASLALAQRGLYDLDPEVRRSAANALANRPAREFQDLLIPAFQHPWPPIAQHAAELIAYLKLDELAPKLMPLLDMKNPMVAVKIEGDGPAQYLVTELVRINHLGNCMLCHATSSNTSDLVRGLVPVPGRPLSSPGSSSPYGGSVGTFVRADITYLKQDFSLEQPVRNPGAWPAEQRFDFLLRRRAVNNLEHTALLLAKNPRLADSFPQRDAVQHALTALGRVGAAPRAEGARTAADTEKLAADLVSAPLVQQESLLDKLAEREGDQVTRALALALPQLPETLWKKGRKLLAQRLVRLPVAELRGHLREGKDEMLRAAISAAGKSKGRGAVPDLVACLDQGDPDLLWSLRMSLFELTGQDFGPALDASAEQRQQVQVRWKAWLESQAR